MSIFPDQFKLTGRTALVTGSGRGLGWQMARGLAEAGARVLLHGRSAERLKPQVAQLRDAGFAADAIGFDMADRQAMQAAVIEAGPIDVLIHNVGERDRRPFADISPEDFARLIDVDLAAAHALVKLIVPGMIERGWGRLILVSSIVADLAVPGAISYVAAKGGLSALARGLAAELGAKGITTNALSPGFFATETNAQLMASPQGEKQRDRCPAKRWADPTEIAGAAIFLASPAASYVNGHTLVVDGGVSATYLA
ncbi:gluconate 5-dehydrogenase [Enhydrobacter aerosaccus]|uniref:Gluconate 5-dehydrogenase n=1 Tax=Enhydrobacter aerosaccus TaxID=225324 RepID=A0A1T4SVZ4_9HYPH|nr:SDR family oxidoreductase [Enhydrobacter aerosaccus]SKA32347.1 gluconate 5-dehydrogenase [Enhydrobacter aerosaccus]